MDTFPASLLIDGIPAAAVVLSSEAKIVAVNERMGSLTGLGADKGWMLGRPIANLPIALVPTTKPIHRDWTSLLEAAKSRLETDYDFGYVEHYDTTDPHYHGDTLYGNEVESAQFWDNEDKKELALIDTFIYPRKKGSDGWTGSSQRQIRSRMCVRAIRWASTLLYIVTFRRPLNVRQRVPQPSSPIKEADIPILPLQGFRPPGEDAVKTTQSLGSLIGKLIPNCMAILDPDGQVLYFTESWYEFTGLRPEETLGTGWVQVIHPDDVGALTVDWADAVKSARSHWSWEARYRNAKGEYIYFMVRAQSVKDNDGNIEKWYAALLDVNELVLARLEADFRKQALMTLLSQADISLWGIDQSHNLYLREGTLPWDPTCSLDASYNVPAKRPSQSDHYQRHGQKHVTEILQDILDGRPFQSYIEHQEGDRWYRSRLIADTQHGKVSNEGVRSVTAALGFTIDVTDVKARAQLQIDNESLAATSRAASEATQLKSRFLANMSHEIRTPIAGILGLGEILRDTKLTPDQKQLCDDVANSATFLLTLVNDILDFSKIEASHMDIEAVPFSPSRIVDGIHSFITLEAKKKDLVLTFGNHLPQDTIVIGDSRRLQQVLTNLLSNAIKFTQHGSVSLDIRAIPTESDATNSGHDDSAMDFETNLDQQAFSDEQEIVVIQFQVKDTGCGIDDETMAKLFRPFTQADSSTARKHGGTGLGLTISRQLVELMGGYIELTSKPALGSTANVRIPYRLPSKSSMHRNSVDDRIEQLPLPSINLGSESSRTSARGSPTPVASPLNISVMSPQIQPRNDSSSEVHILVVEDNAINQKVILYAIRKLGFSATAVWNGQEAVEYLSTPFTAQDQSRPRPDIILMDCMMPVLDGYQATQIVRSGGKSKEIPESIRQIPIIALTASTTKGDRERCEEAGMNDYLPKPIIREDLRKKLAKYLNLAK